MKNEEIIFLKKREPKTEKNGTSMYCYVIISECAMWHSCVIESFRVHEGFIHFSR